MPSTLFLPTQIPWDDLKSKALEELLYWLFDAMGAKDMEWRVGGTGQGTADQGRDLELSFYASSPDGELVKQRWWVEAKGRSGTVEPTEVKGAVLNVAGKTGIDVLVVATNTAFSNPTRDWVKEWQASNPSPKIKLWERTELENHCSKNPIAVLRLFSKALTAQGRLEVLHTKLWDYVAFSDAPALTQLWAERDTLDINSRALMALVASEITNGNIEERSWGVFVDTELVLETLGDSLINFLYLISRAHESGVRTDPLVQALAYLTLIATDRLGHEMVARLLAEVWDTVEGREYPDAIRNLALQPILQTAFDDVRDICISDCRRVITKRVSLSEKQTKSYLKRLAIANTESSKKDERILTIESLKEPCKLGLKLDKDNHCPLCAMESVIDDVGQTLSLVHFVSSKRKHQDDA